MKDIEILVHISAPGGVRDDSRYRLQVQAILDFEAVSQQAVFRTDKAIWTDSLAEEVIVSHASSDEDSGPLNSGDELRSVNPGNSPSHQVDREFKAVSADVLEPQLRTSQEVISISSTDLEEQDVATEDKTETGEKARQSSSLAHQLSPPKGTPLPSSPSHSESTPFSSPLRIIPDSQPPSESESRDRDLSDPEHVQVTAPFSLGTPSERKRRRQHSPAGATESPVAEASNISSSSRPEGVVVATEQAREPETQQRSQRDKTPPNLVSPCHPIQGPTHSISLSSLPLQIHPPPPPVSTGKFQTHVTPTLQMLAERLKFSRRFTPVRQSRDLDRLERGHWFFRLDVLKPDIHNNGNQGGRRTEEMQRDKRVLQQSENMDNVPPPGGHPTRNSDSNSGCSNRATWTYPFFAQFWSFLDDFIARDGRAGWGVWCILEERQTPNRRDHSRLVTVSRLTDPSERQRGEFGTAQPLTMKVYAWGEIASHIYLLLFLASERRIRGMQAEWRDGAEDVVIQMP
ncbi:hypothetical protein V8E54_001195 [Elaphomyces granulatus]|jgi:hypothetical protein